MTVQPASLPAVAAGQPLRFDRVAAWLLFGQIIGVTFLQKLAVPLGGSDELFLGLLVLLGLTAAGVVTQRLQVSPRLFIAYCVTMSVMALVQFMSIESFSVASLLLMMTVHAPYMFRLRPRMAEPGVELRFFQKIMVVLSLFGVLQYGLQFVIGYRYAYFMDTVFPQSFIAPGFHALNPIGTSGIYKATAFFFLEPALLCQFLAIAVLIEMTYFRNYKRLMVFLAGIAVTFSGTGLIILGVLAPVYLVAKRQYAILALGFVLVLTAGVWAPLVGLEHTYERVFEFTDPRTSGFARFISMFLTVREFLLPKASTFFFGLGSGTIHAAAIPGRFGYSTFDPTWGKIIFEYGLFGLIAYQVLLVTVFSTGKRSKYLKAGLLLQFLLLGEFLLPPTVHGLLIALIVWPRSEEFANRPTLAADGTEQAGEARA